MQISTGAVKCTILV